MKVKVLKRFGYKFKNRQATIYHHRLNLSTKILGTDMIEIKRCLFRAATQETQIQQTVVLCFIVVFIH